MISQCCMHIYIYMCQLGRGYIYAVVIYIVLEHSCRWSHHTGTVFWITYSVNIDRQAGRCVQRHCWHCVFIRCGGGCSPYLAQQLLDYLLLHEDWGECSEGWAGAWGWGVEGWGRGVEVFSNWKKKSLRNVPGVLKLNFDKNVPGVLKRAHHIFVWGGGILGCLGRPTPPPGGRAGSESDTLLPMTMTCDRLKFWNGPSWRSKIIIRKPRRRKNKK